MIVINKAVSIFFHSSVFPITPLMRGAESLTGPVTQLVFLPMVGLELTIYFLGQHLNH